MSEQNIPPINATRPAPRKRRRLLLATIIALSLLLALPLGVLFWAAQFESGTAALWRFGLHALSGQLTGTYVSGTLTDGLHLRNVVFRGKDAQIDIDDIEGRWQFSSGPLKLSTLASPAFRLSVQSLHIGTVTARLSGQPSAKPVLPQNLQLPLALTLHAVTLDKLILYQGLTGNEFSGLAGHGESDKVQHSLAVDRLTTPLGQFSGNLQVGAIAPFALSGAVRLAGSHQRENFQLDARLSGTLAALDLDARASGDKLNGLALIKATPFGAVPFERIELSAGHINPKLFNASAPQADLAVHASLKPVIAPTQAAASGRAPSATTGASNTAASALLAIGGPITVSNAQPGALDADRLPLIAASAEVLLDSRRQQLTQLRISMLNKATLEGHGELRQSAAGMSKPAGEFQFNVAALDLHAMHGKLQATDFHGPLTVRLQGEQQQVLLSLDEPRLKLELDARIDAKAYTLSAMQLSAGAAHLNLSGTIARNQDAAYALQGKLSNFDPALWIRADGLPNPAQQAAIRHNDVHGRISMDFSATGALGPELTLALKYGVHDSEYAGLPMTGAGLVNIAGKRLLPSDLQLAVAGNQLFLKGGFGGAADSLEVKLNAPQLQRLGFGLAGSLQLDGQLSGQFGDALPRAKLHAAYRGQGLAFGSHRVAGVSGEIDFQGGMGSKLSVLSNARIAATLNVQGYAGPDLRLDSGSAKLDGTYGDHRFSASANGVVRGKPLVLSVAAQGKLAENGNLTRWSGTINTLENRGTPRFALLGPMALSIASGSVALGPTRFTIGDAAIDLKEFSYGPGRISSSGRADALDVGKLLALQQEFTGIAPQFKTDLILDARWKFVADAGANGSADIIRRSGDLSLDTARGETALGLTELRLHADLQANQLKLDGQAAARFGSMSAQAQTTLKMANGAFGEIRDWPLSAKLDLSIPQLKSMTFLTGPQVALDGGIAAHLTASGKLAAPGISGSIDGDKLAVTLFDQGIQLRDGIAHLILTENVITMQQLEFHGGDGKLNVTGQVQLGQSNPALGARIVADRLQLFASPDRQLILSGQANVASAADKLHVNGKFTVDHALLDLPKSSAPKLGDDVVIVRRGKPEAAPAANAQDKIAQASEKPAGAFAPVVDVELDLGRDFRFRGTGADLQLRGSMAVHSEPYQALRASGTIRVESGTYEAFGRKLAIERGILNFQGPIDNPNINILAMRRNQEVEAGVEVTGLASRPRIKLISEPGVADEEKLSWLMFGHGSESSGLGQRQAASAALGLLGGSGTKRIAQGIGLDTFSIGASESGLNDQQVINLGKAISERFSIGYEQSLTNAASVAKLTWQMSRRWSLIGRAGAINGLDLLFNRRFE